MNAFIRGLLGLAAAWLAQRYREAAIDLVKIQAAIWRLRAIRTARRIYLLGMAATLCASLAGAGFVLFHIGLFALLPAPANAITLAALGLLYVAVGLGMLRALGSEERWMKAGGLDAGLLPNRRQPEA